MKEYLEALEKTREGLTHYGMQFDFEYYILKQALQRLESIDNASPSEALNVLLDRANHDEYLGRIGKEEALKFLNENQIFVTTIKQALIKAQEQEKVIKELCEYCGMDNLYPYGNLEEIEITFKDTFDNYSRQRIESLGRLNKLEKENAELKAKAQKEHKALEIIKKKHVNVGLVKVLGSVEQYNQTYVYDNMLNVNWCLTEEEFNTLKEVLENE